MVASLVDLPDDIRSPDTVELKVSAVDDSRIGVFCVWPISKGTEFGPYKGKIVKDRDDEAVDPRYSWEVFNLDTLQFLHIIDATNPHDGCWMRYVCCARFFEEQNIVSTQKGDRVFYKALKNIEAGEELLTWFQPKKKKRKRGSMRQSLDEASTTLTRSSVSSPSKSPDKQKRKRKPKIIPDSYNGPINIRSARQSRDDLFEPLQPGQKRRRRKKLTTDSQESLSSSVVSTPDTEDVEPPVFDDEVIKSTKTAVKNEPNIDDSGVGKVSKKDGKKEMGAAMSIAEINNTVDWQFPERGEEFLFELKSHHVISQKPGKKVYKCDICLGLYKHMFSLKRHYLRNHINYKYLSKADMTNCLINLAQVVQTMNERNIESKGGEDKESLGEEVEVKEETDCKDGDKTRELYDDIENTGDTAMSVSGAGDGINTDPKLTLETENQRDEVDPSHVGPKQLENNEDCDKDAKAMENCNTSESSSEVNSDCVSNMQCDGGVEDSTCIMNMQKSPTDLESETDVKSFASTSDLSNESGNVNDLSEVKTEDVSNDCTSKDNCLFENGTEIDREQTNCSPKISSEDNNMQDNAGESVDKDFHIIVYKNQPKTEGSEAASTARRRKRKSPVEMPGLFRCYTCYDVFDDIEGIREHVQNHPESTDGFCFACDQCNMRFNYKQNLVRHKKVHEVEDQEASEDKSSLKTKIKKESQSASNDNVVSETPMAAELKDQIGGSNDKSGVTDFMTDGKALTSQTTYRCDKCKAKFPSLQILMDHVQEKHKSGSKYQCQYCGKDFPSLPNMKKHVRFHLGYRVSCRFCVEVFPNVGALRKHTRLSHPDIYKAKQLDKLARDGVLRKPDKKIKSDDDEPAEQTQSNETKEGNKEKEKDSTNTERNDNEKEMKQYIIDHDVSFAADEIDDGGSRFKFSCTICKKRFSNYINMCRHRRRAHSNEAKTKTEDSSSGRLKRASPVLEDPAEVARFYANVSHNIALNMNCYVDGRQESLKHFVDHIIIEDYHGEFGYSADRNPEVDIFWEWYNFPPEFKPAKTISFSEIRNVLDIHNDFDSHCAAVSVGDSSVSDAEQDPARSDTVGEKTEIAVDKVEEQIQLAKDSSSMDEVKKLVETKEADSSVSKSSLGSAIIKKSSSGLRALASASINGAQKLSKSIESFAESLSARRFTKVTIADGKLVDCSSPMTTQCFTQVQNGEYANFEDNLLPNNVDSPIVKMAKTDIAMSAEEERISVSEGADVPEEANSKSQKPTEDSFAVTKQMTKVAQDELLALYDAIDNHTHDRGYFKGIKSPKSLSHLCEKVLGCTPFTKSKYFKPVQKEILSRSSSVSTSSGEMTNEDGSLFSKLSLSANQTEGNFTCDIQPDFSDAPDGSPFYNYESIAFGKNGDIVIVCSVCKKSFHDYDRIIRHHWKKHPSCVFNFLEIEQGNDIVSLHFAEPSCLGALAVTDPGFENVSEMESFSCTRCGSAFKSISKLHVHIINCSPIDPVYGLIKAEMGGMKTPVKKKNQKKLQATPNNDDNLEKSKQQRVVTPLKDIVKECVNSQKRVFSGCRKRTATILPDSPVKAHPVVKQGQDASTGYNPSRHVRRRELTELVDTHTCEACGLKFKTIILLERHVKHCTKKERFKNLKPMTCPIMDESVARLKNICIYCEKNFTYTKSLMNHLQDFCPVKKLKIDKGELTLKDKEKEEQIIERHLKLETEKIMKEKELDNTARKKERPNWQVGRKVKRKGHAWTYIKKRRQVATSNEVAEEYAELVEEEGINSDDNNINDSDVISTTSKLPEDESNEDNIPDVDKSDSENLDDHNAGELNDFMNSENDTLFENKQAINNVDSVETTDSSEKDICPNNTSEQISDFTQVAYEGLNGKDETKETCNEENRLSKAVCNDQLKITVPLHSREDTNIEECAEGNLSLNCTARYSASNVDNKESAKGKRKRKSSLLFQCVTNQQLKEENEPATEIMGSKRKRARISKVEEFLRGAFRRKRKKKNLDDPKSANRSSENSDSADKEQKEKFGKASECNSILSNTDTCATCIDIPNTDNDKEQDNSGLTKGILSIKTLSEMVLPKENESIHETKSADESEMQTEVPLLRNDHESILTSVIQDKIVTNKSTENREGLKRRPGRPVKSDKVEQTKDANSPLIGKDQKDGPLSSKKRRNFKMNMEPFEKSSSKLELQTKIENGKQKCKGIDTNQNEKAADNTTKAEIVFETSVIKAKPAFNETMDNRLSTTVHEAETCDPQATDIKSGTNVITECKKLKQDTNVMGPDHKKQTHDRRKKDKTYRHNAQMRASRSCEKINDETLIDVKSVAGKQQNVLSKSVNSSDNVQQCPMQKQELVLSQNVSQVDLSETPLSDYQSAITSDGDESKEGNSQHLMNGTKKGASNAKAVEIEGAQKIPKLANVVQKADGMDLDNDHLKQNNNTQSENKFVCDTPTEIMEINETGGGNELDIKSSINEKSVEIEQNVHVCSISPNSVESLKHDIQEKRKSSRTKQASSEADFKKLKQKDSVIVHGNLEQKQSCTHVEKKQEYTSKSREQKANIQNTTKFIKFEQSAYDMVPDNKNEKQDQMNIKISHAIEQLEPSPQEQAESINEANNSVEASTNVLTISSVGSLEKGPGVTPNHVNKYDARCVSNSTEPKDLSEVTQQVDTNFGKNTCTHEIEMCNKVGTIKDGFPDNLKNTNCPSTTPAPCNDKSSKVTLDNQSKDIKKEWEDKSENIDITVKSTNNVPLSSPERAVQEEKFQLVLSPSERVKMNKRSCKKEIYPYSPVWVKRTYKPKPKTENDSKLHKADNFNESSSAKHVLKKIKSESDASTKSKRSNTVEHSEVCGIQKNDEGHEMVRDSCETTAIDSAEKEYSNVARGQGDSKGMVELKNDECKLGKRKFEDVLDTNSKDKILCKEIKMRKSDEVRNRIKEKLTQISQERDKKNNEKQRKNMSKRK